MIVASLLAVLLLVQAVALLVTAGRLRDQAEINYNLAKKLSELMHP